MIQSATGGPTGRYDRIAKGLDKDVYHVKVPGYPHGLILKVQRSDDAPLDQEAWAVEAARDVGVAVPDVLHLGSVAHAGQRLKYMIETKVVGDSLAERLPSLTLAAQRDAFWQMGRVLARLHQCRVEGFWKRHPIHGWDFPTWEAVMASTLENRKSESIQFRAERVFTPSDAEDIFDAIRRYTAEFPCRAPILCHGDYLPEHVFFDRTGRLSGVIDFGMYFGGDRVGDLAVSRMGLDETPFEWMVAGYESHASLGDRFQLQLHLALLTSQLGYLLHHLGISDHAAVERYAAGLRSTLRWLRAHG